MGIVVYFFTDLRQAEPISNSKGEALSGGEWFGGGGWSHLHTMLHSKYRCNIMQKVELPFKVGMAAIAIMLWQNLP